MNRSDVLPEVKDYTQDESSRAFFIDKVWNQLEPQIKREAKIRWINNNLNYLQQFINVYDYKYSYNTLGHERSVQIGIQVFGTRENLEKYIKFKQTIPAYSTGESSYDDYLREVKIVQVPIPAENLISQIDEIIKNSFYSDSNPEAKNIQNQILGYQNTEWAEFMKNLFTPNEIQFYKDWVAANVSVGGPSWITSQLGGLTQLIALSTVAYVGVVAGEALYTASGQFIGTTAAPAAQTSVVTSSTFSLPTLTVPELGASLTAGLKSLQPQLEAEFKKRIEGLTQPDEKVSSSLTPKSEPPKNNVVFAGGAGLLILLLLL